MKCINMQMVPSVAWTKKKPSVISMRNSLYFMLAKVCVCVCLELFKGWKKLQKEIAFYEWKHVNALPAPAWLGDLFRSVQKDCIVCGCERTRAWKCNSSKTEYIEVCLWWCLPESVEKWKHSSPSLLTLVLFAPLKVSEWTIKATLGFKLHCLCSC